MEISSQGQHLSWQQKQAMFFPGKYYTVAFLEPAEEDGEFFTGTGGFLEPAANFFMGAAAFLEPTRMETSSQEY
jgi:hypothetical protein